MGALCIQASQFLHPLSDDVVIKGIDYVQITVEGRAVRRCPHLMNLHTITAIFYVEKLLNHNQCLEDGKTKNRRAKKLDGF